MPALHLVVCRLLELIVLVGRGDRAKELEILVLTHFLRVYLTHYNRQRPHRTLDL